MWPETLSFLSKEPSLADGKKEKVPPENHGNEIRMQEIKKLHEPIKKLLDQLRDKIDSGQYQLIIGEDASGRIPTLIMKQVLENIYDQNQRPRPLTKFFTGSSGLWADFHQQKLTDKKTAMSQYIKKWLGERTENQNTRVLIVTDTVGIGNSIEPICQVLKESGLSFDIATISLLGTYDAAHLNDKLGGELYYGQKDTPDIYKRKSLSGVSKDAKDVFATAPKGALNKSAQLARQDAKILAQKLTDEYIASENRPE